MPKNLCGRSFGLSFLFDHSGPQNPALRTKQEQLFFGKNILPNTLKDSEWKKKKQTL